MNSEIFPDIHRLLQLLIKNSDNEIIQKILNESFGPVLQTEGTEANHPNTNPSDIH
jgi:hypothetical protein